MAESNDPTNDNDATAIGVTGSIVVYVAEAWKSLNVELASTPKSAEHNFLVRLLGDLRAHAKAWAFLDPINGKEAVDYDEVIKRPVVSLGSCYETMSRDIHVLAILSDLNTTEHKLNTNQYSNLTSFREVQERAGC
ncbi:hypothetical protein BU15DRAFT_80554 [Melanogaster broomeanus]|nr:hypothetical protein BU15DRAFT_80554 [Melanogaster broomeanus]